MTVRLDVRSRLSEQLSSLRSRAPARTVPPSDVPTGKSLKRLPVESLYSERQVRETFEGIEELAQSLRERGQLQPVIVSAGAAGRYRIEHGERRWRAAQKAGLTHLDCIVIDEPADAPGRMLNQLTENIQRDNMRAVEITAALVLLETSGYTRRELAEKLGLHYNVVSLYFSLSGMPPQLEAYFDALEIRDITLMSHLSRATAIAPERAMALIRPYIDNAQPMSRAEAQAIYRTCAEEEKKKKPGRIRPVRLPLPKGFTRRGGVQMLRVQYETDGGLAEGYLTSTTLAAHSREADLCVLAGGQYVRVPMTAVRGITGVEAAPKNA